MSSVKYRFSRRCVIWKLSRSYVKSRVVPLSHNFLVVFSFAVYENLQIPIDLKMFCLSFLVFSCVFFFHKMMKLYEAICATLIRRNIAELFYSQTDVKCVVKMRQKYLDILMKCTYMDFSDCLVFYGNPNDFTPLLKKITNNLSVWLPTFHSVFLKEFTLLGRCYYQRPFEDLTFAS